MPEKKTSSPNPPRITHADYQLVVFPTPPDATATLTPDDSGQAIGGVPAQDAEGRAGLGFTLPGSTPQGHGARLTIAKAGMVTQDQHGILALNDGSDFPWKQGQTAVLACDDFTLQNAGAMPGPEPTPPPGSRTPLEVIEDVAASGHFNLTTHVGCGLFSEECCKQLHTERPAEGWGHVKKNPGQNQFNGHAVDAIQVLRSAHDHESGVYDIIFQSVAPDAAPAFNRQHGPQPELWFYPAEPLMTKEQFGEIVDE